MRLTSEFWVSQLVRRVFAQGGFAAVIRKGAAEAGSIFIILRRAEGAELFAPSPQTEYDSSRPQERLFTRILQDAQDEALNARIEKEARFDSDLWVVELEPAPGAGDLFEMTIL